MESILHGAFFHHGHHENHHTHHDDEHQVDLLKPPKVSLRTMSKSDPHLDIPHLLMSQDEAHPSLNKIMSNLQHVHEGLKTPVSSHPNLQALKHENELPERFARSSALLTQEKQTTPSAQPALRKSSSAIDWNGAVVQATRKASRQYDWPSNTFESAAHDGIVDYNQQQHQVDNRSTEHDRSPLQGGLVMSSLDNKKGMSLTAAQIPSQQTTFGHSLANSAAVQASQHSAGDHHLAQHRESPGSGMFGVFNRGFFSKPVVRSEEENYRYLMALDR